jgi:hypothetical protein
MATEKYTTLGQSTLSVGVDAVTVTIPVVSAASFPTTGDFRIRIDNEILKVTSVAGNNLTVLRGQEGTIAAVHSGSAVVTEVLTAAALDQIRQDIHQTGADAAKVAEKAGNLYLPNNGFQLYRDSGAAFVPFGPIFPFTAPVDGDFAWVNQGGASISTANGGIFLNAPAGAGNNMRIRKKAAPATPYTITAAIVPQLYPEAFANCGLLFRNSGAGTISALAVSFSSSTRFGVHLQSLKLSSPTLFSAAYVDLIDWGHVYKGGVVFIRIADDGTNRICSWSFDGINFLQAHSVGRTDFLTADEVGFYVESNNANSSSGMLLLSWKQG